MANTNAAYGLKPVKQLDGSSWNSVVNVYFIPQADTNAYYVGDVVSGVAGGDVRTGLPAVELTGTRGAPVVAGGIRGVVVGTGTGEYTGGNFGAVEFDADNLNTLSIPAVKTKDYFVWVVDSPTVIFEAQTDTIEATAFNKNVPFLVGAEPSNPVNGSLTVVQGSAADVAATLPLKVLGAPSRVDNDLTSPATDAKVYVLINQHELLGNSVGV